MNIIENRENTPIINKKNKTSFKLSSIIMCNNTYIQYIHTYIHTYIYIYIYIYIFTILHKYIYIEFEYRYCEMSI